MNAHIKILPRSRKLRAWDPKAEKWVSVSQHFDFDSNGEMYQISVKGYDLILVDWIGSKDETGKDIFEGDIIEIIKVQSVCPPDMVGRRYEIIWNPSNGEFAGFGLINKNYKEKYKDEVAFSWYTGGNTKVIGNIFENPELLK